VQATGQSVSVPAVAAGGFSNEILKDVRDHNGVGIGSGGRGSGRGGNSIGGCGDGLGSGRGFGEAGIVISTVRTPERVMRASGCQAYYEHFIGHQISAAMAPPSRRATTPQSVHGNNREDKTMRKTLIALAATTGLIGLGTIGASAAPVAPVHVPAQASAVQQADWYCGQRCQASRHARWEHHAWREHHRPYYGYNSYYGNPYYHR
jgi:hypothetical protein